MERPKEWEQERDRIICEYIAGSDPEDPDLGDIFEAGADAMLEALGKEGVHLDDRMNPTNTTVGGLVDFLDKCLGGTVVFIPDEEAKE